MATAPFPDDRLVPGPIRRPAAALAAVCAVAFLALAVIYHGAARAGRLDSTAFAVLPHASESGPVGAVATAAPFVAFGVAVVVTTAMLAARRWRAAALAAAGPAVAMLVTEVGKQIIDRRINGYLALPSGHTAGVTSVALAVAVLMAGRSRAHVLRTAVLGLLATTLLGAGIALVMVVVHGHYATDTVAGFCVAVATTLGTALAIDRWSGRRRRADGIARSEAAAGPPGDRLR